VDRTRIVKALECVLPSLGRYARMEFVLHQTALCMLALAAPVAARVTAVAAQVRAPAPAQALNPVTLAAATRAQTPPLRQNRTVLSQLWDLDSSGQSVVVPFLAQSSSLDISVNNVLLVLERLRKAITSHHVALPRCVFSRFLASPGFLLAFFLDPL
jgi:hypothetical protein